MKNHIARLCNSDKFKDKLFVFLSIYLDETNLIWFDFLVDACEELKTFVTEKEAEGAINCNDIVREAR